MPQELRILQCYKCSMFQVDIVKKAPKWICKLCGEKQTVKQEFGRGSGKDCRLQVQTLNDLRREQDEMQQSLLSADDEKGILNDLIKIKNDRKPETYKLDKNVNDNGSKWSQFIEENSDSNQSEGDTFNESDEIDKNCKINSTNFSEHFVINQEEQKCESNTFGSFSNYVSDSKRRKLSDTCAQSFKNKNQLKMNEKINKNCSKPYSKWDKYLSDNDNDTSGHKELTDKGNPVATTSKNLFEKENLNLDDILTFN